MTTGSEPTPEPIARDDAQSLTSYLASVDGWGNELPTDDVPAPPPYATPTSPSERLMHRLLPRERRFRVRYAVQHRYTDALQGRERRRAAQLASRAPLLLHLGCGPFPKPGWINIDLAGHPVDLRWNLARPLPFEAGSVDGIFHEHLLEHLPLSVGLDFLRANHRLLRPGGVLRVVVPDAGSYLSSYAAGGLGLLEAVRSNRPTNMLAINELFYLYTHTAMYDEETLALFLRTAGFSTVESSTFGTSRLQPCPDSEHRRPESLYIEAVK